MYDVEWEQEKLRVNKQQRVLNKCLNANKKRLDDSAIKSLLGDNRASVCTFWTEGISMVSSETRSTEEFGEIQDATTFLVGVPPSCTTSSLSPYSISFHLFHLDFGRS